MTYKFKNRNTFIYNKLQKLFKAMGKDFKQMELGDSIRLQSDGFMDLVVSRIGDDVIALEHNFIQHGDLMVDPRIDVRIIEHSEDLKLAEAITFENSSLGIYQEIYVEREGKQYVNTGLKTEVNAFLHQWLINLEQQGFYK